MIYFDTSYLLRCYYDDPVTKQSAGWPIRINSPAGHGRVELGAALHRKLRERALTASDMTFLRQQIEQDSGQGYIVWFP